MNPLRAILDQWEFNRTRTLATLDTIAKLPDPQAVLGWRPGPGRAHIAWQLTHVAITEELFATERLVPGTTPAWTELVSRFKGGSAPDDDIPALEQIREILTASRQHLLATVGGYTEQDLARIPDFLRERGWTVATALKVLAWHEPHHQGQAHITLNLWKVANL